MLFPESDEDIWKHEDMQISVSPLGVHMTKGDSKGKKRLKFARHFCGDNFISEFR